MCVTVTVMLCYNDWSYHVLRCRVMSCVTVAVMLCYSSRRAGEGSRVHAETAAGRVGGVCGSVHRVSLTSRLLLHQVRLAFCSFFYKIFMAKS